MNKRQMREAVLRAIQLSDEYDVSQQSNEAFRSIDRGWLRLNMFLVSLATSIGEGDAVLEQQIHAFQERVIANENPLLTAAPDAQEKSK